MACSLHACLATDFSSSHVGSLAGFVALGENVLPTGECSFHQIQTDQ